MRNEVKILNKETVQVTKAFEKKARIFGTVEFYKWQEVLKVLPDAKMQIKASNRKPNKNKNRSYENIKAYIQTQENSEKLLVEFENARTQSKVQTNPYEYMLSWFDKNFPDYRESTVFKDTEKPETNKVVDIKSAA